LEFLVHLALGTVSMRFVKKPGCSSSLSEYKPEYSVVSYAPIVDAKPSDMSTVYTKNFRNVFHLSGTI
jgi:hypothetical protein